MPTGRRAALPRRLLPARKVQGRPDYDGRESHKNSPQLRRHPIKAACVACRRRKLKCTGERPSCIRCANEGAKCSYDTVLPNETRYQALKRENDDLREQNVCYKQLYGLIQSCSQGESEGIISQIRIGSDPNSILRHWKEDPFSLQQALEPQVSIVCETPAALQYPAERTKSSVTNCSQSTHDEDTTSLASTQSIGSLSDAEVWRNGKRQPDTDSRPQSQVESWVEGLCAVRKPPDVPNICWRNQVLWGQFDPQVRLPGIIWTNVTDNVNVVYHLLAMYFSWEYPIFAPFSKVHFLQDFQAGQLRYCSPALVNALLALGCRLSNESSTGSDCGAASPLGDDFFQECQQHLSQETDHHSLTTIQALGIMSVRESGCGRGSVGRYYASQCIRLALEMGLHRTDDGRDDDKSTVQLATFWGAFALDNAWSLVTGSLPQCSRFPRLPPKCRILNDIENSPWIPYDAALANAPYAPYAQPSNILSVYACLCELSQLVHQSMYLRHLPNRLDRPGDMWNNYTQYLKWYAQLPEFMRLGHNSTPAVLFCHMYYHFAILHLSRHLSSEGISGSRPSSLDIGTEAATTIKALVQSYSRLYTSRRIPSFVCNFILS